MKRDDAKICIDCLEIYKGDMICPECGNKSGISLSLYIKTMYEPEEQGCC